MSSRVWMSTMKYIYPITYANVVGCSLMPKTFLNCIWWKFGIFCRFYTLYGFYHGLHSSFNMNFENSDISDHKAVYLFWKQ